MADTVAPRLSRYRLATADAFQQDLVVPEGKSLTLSAPAAGKSAPGYVTLTPKDIADAKLWLGVPDPVGKRRKLRALSPADLALARGAAAAAKVTPEQHTSLQALAYQYVYGDSTALANDAATISKVVSGGSIVGVFLQNVDVLPNAELKLAANLKVFFANDVRIWKGGRIVLLGNIKVDCNSIVGNYTAPKIPIVLNPSLNLGIIANFGG
jgi:hypothetical protein